MSIRLGLAVLALASMAASAGVADEASEIEELLTPRALVPMKESTVVPAAVRLVWTDPAGAATGLEYPVRAEAERLLRRMGVQVSWRRGEPGELAREGEVRIILLDRPATLDSGAPVLGATPPTFAGPPFVWVHVPGVSSMLGLRSRWKAARMNPFENRALATALGRVVVHEVVHAVAPSLPHGTGLMSASLTRRHLTAGTIPFDPEVGLVVRAALRGDTPFPRPDSAVLAAATGSEEVKP